MVKHKNNPYQRNLTNADIKVAYQSFNKLVPEKGKMKAIEAVSIEYQLSTKTMKRYFNVLEEGRLEKPTRKINSKYSDELKTRIWEYYLEGHSMVECVRKFKIPRSSLYKILRDSNGGFLSDDLINNYQ